MIYNVSMKIAQLLENEQAVQVFDRFLPGMRKMAEGNPQAASLSVEQLVRYTRNPKADEVIAALESMGLTDVKYELGTMQFAGKEHACVYITGQINGTTLYETQVCVKNGNYVGSITASTVGGDGTGEILGAFEAK